MWTVWTAHPSMCKSANQLQKLEFLQRFNISILLSSASTGLFISAQCSVAVWRHSNACWIQSSNIWRWQIPCSQPKAQVNLLVNDVLYNELSWMPNQLQWNTNYWYLNPRTCYLFETFFLPLHKSKET